MSSLNKRFSKASWFKLCLFVFGAALFYVGSAYAESTQTSGVGHVAETIVTSFSSVGKLMVAIAYLAGFGFVIAAIFKFKQHKDNPTQIPMGTPIAILVIGISLIFTPGIMKMGGETAGFGSSEAGGFTGAGALIVPGASPGAGQ